MCQGSQIKKYRLCNVLGGPLKFGHLYTRTAAQQDFIFALIEAETPVISVFITAEFLSFWASLSPELWDQSALEFKENEWQLIDARLWKQAFDRGIAPFVDVDSTPESALKVVTRDVLFSRRFALWELQDPSNIKNSQS